MDTEKFKSEDIAQVLIYPPIGVARIGNSTDEYFIGPEFDPPTEAPKQYKDAKGRIKRQGARFRLYAFSEAGALLGEIGPHHGSVTWSVHLANKKAAWFEFHGATKALQAFRGERPAAPPRNDHPEFGEIVLADGKFRSNEVRARLLEVDGGLKSIAGVNISPNTNENAQSMRFEGAFHGGERDRGGSRVYLGELRTDEAGRLVVLGGHGESKPVDAKFSEDRFEKRRAAIRNWITNYANNDYWHDDTSDGSVDAEVKLSDGRTLKANGGAWVIVAPPDFAPEVANIVTLYDVIEEVAVGAGLRSEPGAPNLPKRDDVDFARDIQPLLLRMNDYRWVSPLGLRGHGNRKPGDFSQNSMPAAFSEPDEAGKTARAKFFSVVRKPAYAGFEFDSGDIKPDRYAEPEVIRQANPGFMPPLSGDEGDRTNGSPATWLTVTHLQYHRLKKWAVAGAPSAAQPALSPPALLTRSAMTACAGGAFFPGIEMTSIARDPRLYAAAFRLDRAQLEPGDITKYMACPWQADFYECRDDWWPAQRPDEVITAAELDSIARKFDVMPTDPAMLFFDRVRWDRGLERRPWPDTAYVRTRVEPVNGEKPESYIERLCDLAVEYFVAKPRATSNARLPSPWRAQFMIQDALDQIAGRFFLPEIPAPEDVFGREEVGRRLAGFLEGRPELHLPRPGAIRDAWDSLREKHGSLAKKILDLYLSAAEDDLKAYVRDVLASWGVDRGEGAALATSEQIFERLQGATINPLDHLGVFDADSAEFKELRVGECWSALGNFVFMDAAGRQGDMAMVDQWKSLGFVRSTPVFFGRARTPSDVVVQSETERDSFTAASFREHFYKLMNIQDFPEYFDYSTFIVEEILADTQRLIDFKLEYDDGHPESFVPYSAEAFTAKLEEIYEHYRAAAARPMTYAFGRTREEYAAAAVLPFAVFNQLDGAWLRFIADAGPEGGITPSLFSIWSDEVGNGDPALNHANLFTQLLHQLKFILPDVSSKEYSEHKLLGETQFVGPVFELAISQNTKKYLPEIIGMTLFLEWEVLDLAQSIPRFDYYGIDSKFYRMHVGIDNASDGHGARARDAVIAYLDKVLQEGGPVAQQEQWKRIWRGFVAFATTGYDMFQSFETSQNSSLVPDQIAKSLPRAPADDVSDLIQRKLPFGHLNHFAKHLGIYRINDLFDMTSTFLEELQFCSWIVPGRPDDSRFLTYLTTFDGPMYKVFNSDDLAIWRRWIEWLGKEGATTRPKKFISRADAMLLLVAELKSQMIASSGHSLYRIHSGKRSQTLSELFTTASPLEIMKALRSESNGYVVVFQPAKSALIADLLRPGREMGSHLDRHFPRLQGQVGRMVIYEWIASGCPLPDEPPPSGQPLVHRQPRLRTMLVQQYGKGSVH
jgi:hypothetical protein